MQCSTTWDIPTSTYYQHKYSRINVRAMIRLFILEKLVPYYMRLDRRFMQFITSSVILFLYLVPCTFLWHHSNREKGRDKQQVTLFFHYVETQLHFVAKYQQIRISTTNANVHFLTTSTKKLPLLQFRYTNFCTVYNRHTRDTSTHGWIMLAISTAS